MHTTRMKSGVYYYQRKIPLEYQAHYDHKSKFMFSLNTKDRSEARRKASLETVRIDAEFAALERHKQAAERLTANDLLAIAVTEANAYLASSGETLRGVAFAAVTEDSPSEPAFERLKTELRVIELVMVGPKTADDEDDYDDAREAISKTIDRLIEHYHLPRPLPADKRALLTRYYLQQAREVRERLLIELRDPLRGQAATPISTNDIISVPVLGAAVEEFLNDKATDTVKATGPKYMNRYTASMEVFVAFAGSSTALKDVRYKSLKALRDVLLKYPTNAKKMPQTRDFTAQQIIRGLSAGKFSGMETLSPATINGYLGKVKEFFDFAVKHEWISSSPYHPDLLVPDSVTDEEKRLPFTDEQLRLILTQEQDKDLHKWAARIALSMGLRLNEIMQLHRTNFEVINGLLCIREEIIEEGQRLKTATSRRTLPVPQKLLDMGFAEWLETTPTEGSIFGATTGTSGYYSEKATKDYNRFLRRLGIKPPKGRSEESFHSLRHNYRDAFRRKEIPQEIAEALGGWAESEGRKKKAVSNNYGSGFTLEQRKKYLDMLEFPYF